MLKNSADKTRKTKDAGVPAPAPKSNKDFLNYIRSNGQVYKLKVGEVIRLETDISHFYWVNGVFAPGVSTILSEASPTPYGLKMFWQNNTKQEADTIFETAGDFGSKMHDAFEKLLHGIELNLLQDYPQEREKKCLMSFADWFKHFTPTNFQAEQIVASKKYKYAGTLDFVGKIGDEVWLIDFKTSNAIHMAHQLQVMAYKQAYEESYGIKIDRCGVLRLGTSHKGNGGVKNKGIKTSGKGWEFKEVKEYKIDDFMKLYKVYLMLHGGKIPEPSEIAVYPESLQIIEELTPAISKKETESFDQYDKAKAATV